MKNRNINKLIIYESPTELLKDISETFDIEDEIVEEMVNEYFFLDTLDVYLLGRAKVNIRNN